MALLRSIDGEQRPSASARHYPLDFDLPFEHYEHRRIGPRDIIVNRVMQKLMFPKSKGLAQTFDARRKRHVPDHPLKREDGLHNFGPIRAHDRELARDLELLRKMLTTCSVTERHPEPLCFFMHLEIHSETSPTQHTVYRHRWRAGVPGRVAGGNTGRMPPTVGQEIIDLVTRHYLETDDACLRLWLQAMRPPSLSSYNTLPTSSRPEQTRAAPAQRRKRREKRQMADDGKKWYPQDAYLLAATSARLFDNNLPPLYDGGPFLPQLRLPLVSSKSARADYLASITEADKDMTLYRNRFWDCIMDMVYPWPEARAPRRVLHIPSRAWPSGQQWVQVLKASPPVDFSSGMTGRGLGRNPVWSTAVSGYGVVERGRSIHRSRRRATSEPPPGLFTSARLPLLFSCLDGVLTFPQMKLDTLYQRSRRRSLSRTRVAEMFDWNTRRGGRHDQGTRREEPQHEAQPNPWQAPSAHRFPTRLHDLNECLEDSIRQCGMNVEEVDWAGLNRMLYGVLGGDDAHHSCAHPCSNCASTHSVCTKPCGFCGAPSPNSQCVGSALSLSQVQSLRDPGQGFRQHDNLHTANDCPVAKQNRCKCVPFPQYHVATKCAVLCSRDCGNPYPPGHFKHKSAMTCKSRCCMCGIKGHSGLQCKLKRCRCGGSHLGQDCTWKVECRVKGCFNFLCGLHCSECGTSRKQLEEGMRFEGRKCPACLGRTNLGADMPVDDTGSGEAEAERIPSSNAASEGSQRRGRKDHRKRRGKQPQDSDTKVKGGEKEELPWYAPLQPRTRPIVLSKSGKRNTWRGAASN
ncbi:hypothetical protein KVR01_002538 [Diaporthe batatas]|uniref:uncharacterized protein n=1 Tax=Diaporthe batatas TaxID=748121 RepID=UPI001D05B7D2|nr:uncharacterized protein KVR01_002538 [Diaporthe batatas]KAG8166849.1 hypothetical protein KVR01_002538 [Diaporthe batatas]